MNREEILAKSQKENEGQMDERDKQIEIRANGISQCVGMALCIALGALAYAVTNNMQFMDLSMSVYLCTFSAERIACAVLSKSRGQWIFAGIITVVAIAYVTVFLLKLFGVM